MRIALASCAASTLLAVLSAYGAEPEAQAEPACVEVEVDGQHVPAYDCLTRKLDASRGANTQRKEVRLESEQIATRPSNEIGLFNRAATSQRMGNTFGKTVSPQRPSASFPAPPITKRP